MEMETTIISASGSPSPPWQSGTDSTGSAEVARLTGQSYAFATVNYTLIPSVTVEEQVHEVADSLGYLVRNAARLDFDLQQIIQMGHSSGAHVVTLLSTDGRYLKKAGLSHLSRWLKLQRSSGDHR